MPVYIAAIHMSGGSSHQHISTVVWMNGSTFQSGISSRDSIVQFINGNNSVKVSDGTTQVDVGVWKYQGGSYLRTYADGKWTDNLLALPRY